MEYLSYTPLLPVWIIITFAVISALLCLWMMRNAPLAGVMRLLTCGLITVFFLQPNLREEVFSGLDDIVLLLSDQSASQSLGERQAQIEEAQRVLKERLETQANVEIREYNLRSEEETDLRSALQQGLSDIPRGQLSGVFMITDGQSSTELPTPQSLNIDVPVHTLLTGNRQDTDRVLEIINAPRYGIINEEAEIKFKVSDLGMENRLANILIKIDGRQLANRTVRVGEEETLWVKLDKPGKTLVELIASPMDGELTNRNNRAVLEVSVIRDRLRVLLISGEPHAGERVWRNLLKSDPAVDLIHFTILKPATKPRIAAQEELALIRFPENELFLEKLDEFDVLIFDRYTYRGVMSPLHFDNISRYVQEGGAILISSGPEFIGMSSIATRRNLSYILPARPDGSINDIPFIPEVSETGQKHPVTNALTGQTEWGRWLRSLGVTVSGGQTLLERENGAPLLVVDRVGNGRVGLLLSDHVWLWARDFDGGGPHRELLKRLVHWLMKEPELEEEAVILRSNFSDNRLTIMRRSLQTEIAPITVEAPDGTITTLTLEKDDDGQFSGSLTVQETGFYTATTQSRDGRTLFDVVAHGISTPKEFLHVIATPETVAPLAEQSSAGIYRIENGIPSIRAVRSTQSAAPTLYDGGWAGIVQKRARNIETVTEKPLLPRAIWLLLIASCLLLAWIAESGFKRIFN